MTTGKSSGLVVELFNQDEHILALFGFDIDGVHQDTCSFAVLLSQLNLRCLRRFVKNIRVFLDALSNRLVEHLVYFAVREVGLHLLLVAPPGTCVSVEGRRPR